MNRKFYPLAAVIVALGAIYGIGLLTGNSGNAATGTAASRPTAVTSVIRACPPAPPGGGLPRIVTISVPARTAAGATVLAPLSGTATVETAKAGAKATGQPDVTLSKAGSESLVMAPAQGQQDATSVAANGAMAQGLAAEQVTASGLSTIRCTDPGSSLWFVGTGLDAGAANIRLYLMNVDDLPATVDVNLATDAGPTQASDTGIVVPAHQTVVQTITQYVRGSAALSVNVQTTAGRVAAAVWESSASGGGSWLPAATAPTTKLIIPGLTSAASAARLFIVVPGTGNAEVKVAALTQQGRDLPFGPEPLNSPAGAASSFSLSSLGGTAAAIELTSNVPITAGVLVPGNDVGAFTAAVPPVVQQGVIAGNPAGSGYSSALVLTAPQAAVHARITVFTSTSTTAASSQQVTILAGRTLAVPVSAPRGAKGAFAAVITPLSGSGPLYAARLVTQGGIGPSGNLLSIMPVPSAPTALDLPTVRDSYTAVMP